MQWHLDAPRRSPFRTVVMPYKHVINQPFNELSYKGEDKC
jgi:hypothetical protein